MTCGLFRKQVIDFASFVCLKVDFCRSSWWGVFNFLAVVTFLFTGICVVVGIINIVVVVNIFLGTTVTVMILFHENKTILVITISMNDHRTHLSCSVGLHVIDTSVIYLYHSHRNVHHHPLCFLVPCLDVVAVLDSVVFVALLAVLAVVALPWLQFEPLCAKYCQPLPVPTISSERLGETGIA